MKKRMKVASVIYGMLMMILSSGCGLEDYLTEVGNPSTQVVNNSGSSLNIVKVGGIEFSQYLDDGNCLGCSTGFKEVLEGSNSVMLQLPSSVDWMTIGNLEPFENDSYYAVNITQDLPDVFCAELWKRYQTDSEFNNDTTKELLDSSCVESVGIEGAWFIDNPDEYISYTDTTTNNPLTVYVVVGPGSSGTLTDVGGFYNGPGIGSYQVIDSSTFTLTIEDTRTGIEPFMITCTLATATTGTCTDGATFTAPIRKVNDLTSCAGTWSGKLIYTGGAPDHTVDFSVSTEGVITMNSTTLTDTVTGRLYCDGTEAIGFLRTGASTSEREIKIDAAWDGAQSITGVGFDVDDGCSGGTPNLCVNGTVSLTKQ